MSALTTSHHEAIEVIHNSIDISHFQKDTHTLHTSFETNSFVIGFAGRINQNKGWRTVIKAVSILLENDLDVRLLLAGDGPEAERLRALTQTNDSIEYLGVISYEMMPAFYRSIDCFVLSSFTEAMGLAQLEAQASGTPVIASNIKGVTETISEDNALLFDPDFPEELASVIMMIVKDTDRRQQLREAGLQNASKYSLEHYVSSIEQKVYNT
jgi:glycosyltransferase involved in cell wall biosynthesis